MAQMRVHYVAPLKQLEPAAAVALAAVTNHQSDSVGTVVADRFQSVLPTQGRASFAWTVLREIGQRTKGALPTSAVPG